MQDQGDFKFQKSLIITGKIVTKTGLHIGGNKAELKIGGTDSPVITDHNDKPYIPGSSLKGKLRSMFELSEGKISNDGKVHNCDDPKCPICVIFGSSTNKTNGPTRLIVRDAFTKDDVETELKMENMINRVEGKAEHPRTIERVPSGITFNLEMVYGIYDEDDRNRLKHVFRLLQMLEDSYLGGSGSRGYGKVVINDLVLRMKTIKDYAEGGAGKELSVKDKKSFTPAEAVTLFDELVPQLKD